MLRGIILFVVVWILVGFGIHTWNALKGSQKWTVIKTLAVSVFYAVIALVILVGFVILF